MQSAMVSSVNAIKSFRQGGHEYHNHCWRHPVGPSLDAPFGYSPRLIAESNLARSDVAVLRQGIWMSTGTNAPGNWLPWSLAFVGGFGDAAGFVLAHTFTGHITGNLVLAAVSAAAREWQATLARLAAVVAFLVGVALTP